MAIGDINSKEPGSGARFNDGKPPFRFIPWTALAAWAVARLDNEQLQAESVRRIVNAAECLAPWEFGFGSASRALGYASFEDLTRAADQYAYGAQKYDDWNWALGMLWSVPSECAKRHFAKAVVGLELDDESGVPHTGAFWCNVLMLSHLTKHYPEGDDRPGHDGKRIPFQTPVFGHGISASAGLSAQAQYAAQAAQASQLGGLGGLSQAIGGLHGIFQRPPGRF